MMYIVHRTQLYLDQDLYRALSAAATRQRKTLSEVVRDKLRRSLESEPLVDPARAIDQAVGMWADRDDLPETNTYLRRLREDDRMERLGLPRAQGRRR